MEPTTSCDSKYVRTLEGVKRLIQHSKLEEKDLRPLTQTLYFAKDSKVYQILELDKELYQTMKEGAKLTFRGRKTDKAVLCTKNKTFDIKEGETSNSVLIIPHLKFAEDIKPEIGERYIEEKEVVGIFHHYWELKNIKPRLLRLKQLLTTKPYRGVELEEEDQSGEDYYTFDKLLEHVQSSEVELKEGLVEIGALCINGNWRLLEHDYHFRVLSSLLNLVDSNSWPLDQVPIGECLTELQEIIPNPILHHLFQLYFEPVGVYTDAGDELFRLKEYEVCRFLGTCLLRPVKKFNLQEFMKTWQESVPEGMHTFLEQLAGLAIASPESRPPSIWLFEEDQLPEDIQERFNTLFSAKQRWTYDEIAPYIKRLACEKQSVNALLTKYSRTSNINGVKYFSARYGK